MQIEYTVANTSLGKVLVAGTDAAFLLCTSAKTRKN